MGVPATTAGGRTSVGQDAAMEMEPLVHHHTAAPWSLPAAQILAEREELLLVQHNMEGCSNGEASAAGRPPPLPCIHLLPPHTISSSRDPPLTMMNTRASTATTTPRTWSNSATTSSTTWRRPSSCAASTTSSSPERFIKTRERLLGPNLSTLKAIEILTGCYTLVQGNTVAAMGPVKGLKLVQRIVEHCIMNIKHPVYHIKKELLIKRELAKIPALATESWDRFLPNFKKKNFKQNKLNTKEKKPYTPILPPQQPSKIDLELESGEYFMSDKKKSAKKWQEKLDKQSKKLEEKKRKREAAFVPPKENTFGLSESAKGTNDNNEIADMIKSLKKKARKFRKNEAEETVKIESYVASN